MWYTRGIVRGTLKDEGRKARIKEWYSYTFTLGGGFPNRVTFSLRRCVRLRRSARRPPVPGTESSTISRTKGLRESDQRETGNQAVYEDWVRELIAR